MLRVVAAKCVLTADSAHLAQALMPEGHRASFGRYSQEKQSQILTAYALLRACVQAQLGLGQIPALVYGAAGKPAFAAYPRMHFNLSHTAGLAVCAVSDLPVGVDAERIRPIPPERAQRLQLPAEERAFYDAWVRRESRIKCRGEGALLCRAPVPERAGEQYYALYAGEEYALGVCTCASDVPHLEWMDAQSLLLC